MIPLNFATVASGIEAPSVAWQGWKAVFFSDIDPFCCKLLNHYYPEVPNLGDMTRLYGKEELEQPIDVFLGGTPCQAFSIAGLRRGLHDHRGNLALHFVRLCAAIRSRWIIWENVTGVLSSNGGLDFKSILEGLCGQKISIPKNGWGNAGIIPGIPEAYGLAYRVLDAKHFGVPQQRRRVFLVGHLRDWRAAAAVLFESESMRWDPATGKKTGQVTSALLSSGFGSSGADVRDAQAGHLIYPTLTTRDRYANVQNAENGGLICLAHGQANTELTNGVSPTLNCNHEQPIVFQPRVVRNGRGYPADIADALTTQQGHGDSSQYVVYDGVRRITPIEAERLMGFPDNYTKIPIKAPGSKRYKMASDSHRYKVLGNSIAVPILKWVQSQINKYESWEKQQVSNGQMSHGISL